MTPGANDPCVFAVKRGYIEGKEIYCNTLYPFYLSLIEKYKKSPYCSGKLKDFVEINPKTDCSKLTNEDLVSFVPMPNVQEKTNLVSYDMLPYHMVKKGFTVFNRGDLIWAKITPCMQNGKSCITDKMPTEIGFGSTEFHVVRKCIEKSEEVYMPFVWAILSNDNVLKAAQATFSGSAGQQRVSASFIEEFPAVLPKYNLQVKLVADLEEKLIVMNQKLYQAKKIMDEMGQYIHLLLGINEKEKVKPMIYAINRTYAINARIDHEYHNPFYTKRIAEIKKHEYDTLGNIIDFSTEFWNQMDFFGTTFPYIEISGVRLKENIYEVVEVPVKEAPSRAKMIVRNGDIIISTTRPHRGAIATIVCPEDQIQIASTGFCVLRNLKRDDVLKEYLRWILMDDYVLLQMLQRSSGGNYPAISVDELKKVVIPIPHESVQRQICKEGAERKEKVRILRQEAEQEWKTAKVQFERKLLGE